MKPLYLLTLMHLLVDGICGAVLACYALQESRLEPILFYFGLYTIVAFGLQGIVGWMLDHYPNCWRLGLIASIVFLGLGSLPLFFIGVQAVLIGLGNCIFHVVGGSYVLSKYDTYTELGLFVCSGAIGLGLGLSSLVGVWPLLFFVCALGLYLFKSLPTSEVSSVVANNLEGPFASASRTKLYIAAALLFGCIILRGFGSGGYLDSPYIMLLPCTFALGKFAGGLACDWFGYKKTVLLILGLGFLGLQLQGFWAVILFIFSCNMTMPLTLRLAHWCKISSPGLMFGLAASCLVPGTLFKDYFVVPAQLILVLQFLILFSTGYLLLKKEYENE